MLDRILMELYDDYENNNINGIIQFANKTFPQNGTNIFFIGCVLILFSKASGYKPRYDATKENLYDIVLSAKENINQNNLLLFYVQKINRKKGIRKYFNSISMEQIDEYADLIIEYLNQFRPRFISEVKNKFNKNNPHL